MPKGRIQLRLSELALKNLQERADAAKMTRQDYIERWLAGSQASGRTQARKPLPPEQTAAGAMMLIRGRERQEGITAPRFTPEQLASFDEAQERVLTALTDYPVDLAEAERSTFNSPEVAKKKAGRKERKKALGDIASDAFEAMGAKVVDVTPETVSTYCPKHRPKYCEPDCPHRVSA